VTKIPTGWDEPIALRGREKILSELQVTAKSSFDRKV
jgi:hypothetical protein